MIPRATYRLQFHAGFRFADATALVPYLARLGVSHVYASPYLKARAGSLHGYDIVDHSALNPEIGTEEDFERFVAALRAHGMGHVLDFVPNHMGVGGDDNQWWLDLLTWGPDSHYADYFDVDWTPLREQLHGKVLLPFLGRQYGEVLDAGELRWRYATGGFALRYFEHEFPLTPTSYGVVLATSEAEGLRSFAALFDALAGVPDHLQRRRAAASLQRLLAETEDAAAHALAEKLDAQRTTPDGKALLDGVVERQHWRPASWRVAAEEINYRRFFDINALGALRMEHAAAFADAHQFVFSLVARRMLDGLRLDHVDGLFDPIGYCDLLRSRAQLLGDDPYVVVEKILAPDEELRERWNVDGTTGYEFMNAVTGIAVDARNERAFDRLYRRFTGDDEPFAETAYAGKRFMLTRALSAELSVLARRLDLIAQRDRRTRDYTLGTLFRALIETIACFPVYRTYVRGDAVDPADRVHVDEAIGAARARDAATATTVYDFLRHVLLTESTDEAARSQELEFVMRFQQLTAPIAAKGVEDTAFYRSVRLLALNEVGGDPGRFGTNVADFHARNARRAAHHPHGMLATSTHDAKRGEDARARLAVLSEVPELWRASLARWSRLNARHAVALPGGRAPSPLLEYALYQTLLGAWPVELFDAPLEAALLGPFGERIAGWACKAMREAKLWTSWANPDERYEAGVDRFVRAILDPARSGAFLTGFAPVAKTIAASGAINSLAQVVLKLTVPGVPDTYQGAELWDLALVDPDNRRPIDFALRRRLLDELDARRDEPAALAAELFAAWPDGRIKLYVTATLVRRLRGQRAEREYVALTAHGERAAHAVAFARGSSIVVVPRLPRTLAPDGAPLGSVWSDTAVVLPAGASGRFRDVLTGRTVLTDRRDGEATVRLSAALAVLPVAVLDPL